jgi:hypothetical protein
MTRPEIRDEISGKFDRLMTLARRWADNEWAYGYAVGSGKESVVTGRTVKATDETRTAFFRAISDLASEISDTIAPYEVR